MPTFKALGVDPITYGVPIKKTTNVPKINWGIPATGGQIFNQPIVGADSTTADPDLAGADLYGASGFKSTLPTTPEKPTAGTTASDGTSDQTGTKIPSTPSYTAPSTTAIDTRIASLIGRDPEAEIRDRLARENAAIDAEYTARTLEEQAASRNRMGEQFGGLANLMVNPLSSGAQSVANAEDLTYKKLLQNLDLNRALQKRSAESNIRGDVTSAYANQIKAAQGERQALLSQAQQDYENQRMALQDNIAVINNAVAVAKSKRDATNQERDDARAAYDMQIKTLGSKAFEGVSDDDLRSFEKTAGLPAGFIKKNAETLKQQEIAARYEKPELREVGGNLYSLVWDPTTGQYKKQTIVQKPSGGSGGITGVTTAEKNAAAAAFLNAFGRYPSKSELEYVVSQYKAAGPAGADAFTKGVEAYKNVQKFSSSNPFAGLISDAGTAPVTTQTTTPTINENIDTDAIINDTLKAMQ